MKAAERRRAPLWFLYPIGLATAVSVLYLFTLYPGTGGETDSAKWQFIGKVFGVPHTTGYPLYILVNHVFSLLPIGMLAWRINFMSAFFAVLAVALLQRILRGLLNSELLALGGALVLAVTQMFWTFAVVAGVYSLNAFFICLVMYLLFKWADGRRARLSGARGGRGYLYAACFAYALSLGNHVTMITMLPALVVFALAMDWRAVLSLKTLFLCGLFALIAASLYVLLFVETALPSPYLEHRIRTFNDLWQLLTAEGFRQRIFEGGIKVFALHLRDLYVPDASAQFMPLGLAFAAGGLFLFAQKHGRKLLFILVFLCANLFMALNYLVNPQQLGYQFIPSYVLLALFIGFLPAAPDVVAPRADRAARWILSSALLLVLVGLAAVLAVNNIQPLEEKRQKMAVIDKLVNDAIDALPANGVILANSYNDAMILMYKMLGEERGSAKHWRVLHDADWKITRVDPERPAAVEEVCNRDVVERLMRGEDVDWSPLVTHKGEPAKHEVYFWGIDQPLLDEAGFEYERVHLPGDGTGEDCYGGGPVGLFRITGPAAKPPGG